MTVLSFIVSRPTHKQTWKNPSFIFLFVHQSAMVVDLFSSCLLQYVEETCDMQVVT